MKKVLIYLIVLTVFGCSDEEPLTETVERDLVTTITINESNITGPLREVAGVPGSVNKSLFEVAIPFTLTDGVMNSTATSLKKAIVNFIEFDVTKYNCNDAELHGSFRFNIEPATLVITSLKENMTKATVYYKNERTEKIGQKFSSDFQKRNETIIYLQGVIDNNDLPFEVRLSFRLNSTLELVK
ncbi:MAG TPA: hypothetical protein VFU05_03525 [Cyclobacteriaceae bacterium]|nr:hypothetical protein [Cyclobacteriaceae bacterium]